MAATHFGAALADYRSFRAEFNRIAELDDASRIAGTASDQALGRMIAAPSQSTADLATKLEIMLVEYEDSEWDADRVRVIAEDARRLASPRARWDALTQRLAAVEAMDATDESIDEAGALIGEIMAMPAPDAAAVRWKLDYILDASSGSNDSYSADYLEQLVADYRCALGEA